MSISHIMDIDYIYYIMLGDIILTFYEIADLIHTRAGTGSLVDRNDVG